jgi:hypothetical protein
VSAGEVIGNSFPAPPESIPSYSRTAYSSTLKMEAAGSSETITFYQAVRRLIAEVRENLKFSMF